MRFFFDTEFIEDGRTIDLISIGIVAEDGREYYAVSNQFDQFAAFQNDFVRKHVLTHVMHRDAPKWKPREEIAQEIVAFVGDNPEFWADFAAYDWVALCQLYGRMIDLPKGWPMFCRDVQQLRKMLEVPKFSVLPDGDHHALADARECKARFDVLSEELRARLRPRLTEQMPVFVIEGVVGDALI